MSCLRKASNSRQHILREAAAWHGPATDEGVAADGANLDRVYCAACHNSTGYIRTRWGAGLRHQPPLLNSTTRKNLITDPTPGAHDPSRTHHQIRLPGHEYMPDVQVAALSKYLESREAQ